MSATTIEKLIVVVAALLEALLKYLSKKNDKEELVDTDKLIDFV